VLLTTGCAARQATAPVDAVSVTAPPPVSTNRAEEKAQRAEAAAARLDSGAVRLEETARKLEALAEKLQAQQEAEAKKKKQR